MGGTRLRQNDNTKEKTAIGLLKRLNLPNKIFSNMPERESLDNSGKEYFNVLTNNKLNSILKIR